VLSVTFPRVMAFGGVLGGICVPIPGIEIGIAASAIGPGGIVALRTFVSAAVASCVRALFGPIATRLARLNEATREVITLSLSELQRNKVIVRNSLTHASSSRVAWY
jgi:hypothetical protein